MNGFRPIDFDDILREAVKNLFKLRLPNGKTRWGFKEIRYGSNSAVPETLLRLFPNGKIVHTIRHPFSTIESCVTAWNFKALKEAMRTGDDDAIAKHYRQYANRWIWTTGYFLDLESRNPESVRLSRLETFDRDLPGLLEFLGVPHFEGASSLPMTAINTSWISAKGRGGNEIADWLAKFRASVAPLISEMAEKAGYEIG
ncbi:MAG: sulfotransferase [Hyphomicrobiaceae bacterium]